MSEIVSKQDGSRYARSGRWPDANERQEIQSRIRSALLRGMSDTDAALYAGCATKTVFRYRKARGIPAQVFGGRSPYSQGSGDPS